MTVGIIFYMQDNEQSVFSDVSVWKRLVEAYKVDFYIIIDETSDNKWKTWSDYTIKSHVVNTIDQALHLTQTQTTVLLTDDGFPLKEYKHPKNVVYVFGADGHSIKIYDKVKKINIDTNGIDLWAIQAATITLYDRKTKWH